MMDTRALESLRPGVRVVERDLEDFSVRAVLVTHGRRAVVFDTLAHPSDMTPVAGLVEERGVEVVYSHADWDHCWGTAGLGAVEAVVAQSEAARRFLDEVPRELEEKRRSQPDYEDVILVPPDVTFQRRLDLFLDGILMELHALPGHTGDSLVAFVPEWGLLLAGDAVETPLPVLNHRSLLDSWIDALDAWSEDPRVTTVVPSHGCLGGRGVIAESAAYLKGLREGRFDPPVSSEALEPFYRDTHARNVAMMGG